MACAACPLEPSEENTNYLKWLLLLKEGGAMVLRHLFDTKVPPTNLNTHLNKSGVRNQLMKLHKGKRISDKQKDLLYPQSGTPDSATFDITLLSCLLQNVCKLNQASVVWTGIIHPNDFSVEADICRIRATRNEVCHSNQTFLKEGDYTDKYQELEQILLRLGQTMPILKTKLDEFKSSYIDKECEKALIAKTREWKELDEMLQEAVKEIKDEQRVHSNTLASLSDELCGIKVDGQRASEERYKLKGRVEKLDANIESIYGNVVQVQVEVQTLTNTTHDQVYLMRDMDSRVRQTVSVQEQLAVATNRLTFEIGDVQTAQQKLKEELEREKAERMRNEHSMSSEMKNIAYMSRQHIDEAINNQELYFETKAHEKAYELLSRNNFIVISGHPGEGKTTMALQLASEISDRERFLRIRDPNDWRRVDWSLGLFNTVLIDDIYGAGVMDDNLVKEWDRCLPDMQKMVKKGGVKIIIVTRDYILEDAKEMMKKQQLFTEENVIQLASKDLTVDERTEILKKHMNKRQRQINDPFIDECLERFDSFLQDSINSKTEDFEFGFPQSVDMFTSNDSLFDRGSIYFSQPNDFVRNCIEELCVDDEKFLAMVMIWARRHKPLLIKELSLSSPSNELTRIARSFGFKLTPKLTKILRKSLKHHKNGLVDYNPREGSYSFSHNVIADMVGLVIGKYYPDEALEYISRDFLLAYLTTDDRKNKDFHFFVEERLFKTLSQKLVEMLLNPHRRYKDENVQRFRSRGNCPNQIHFTWKFDSSLVMFEAFSCKKFVSCFLDVLGNKTNGEKFDRFLKEPVMKISGHFPGMGMKLTVTDSVTLPVYFLMNKNHLVMMELINSDIVKVTQDELEVPMLIAIHNNDKNFVSFLLDKGAQPTEEAKYIAALDGNLEMLKLIMRRNNFTTGKKCTILNGNSALTVASKKGLTESVKCLLDHGADINHRNTDGLRALDKAVIYNHVNVCKVLIEAGAALNMRSGKFKRTPLHVAADKNQRDIVKLLLHHGASAAVKDHRGHYAIHLAAIGGFTDVVKTFLEHDINLSKQRIISYGKASYIRGMTVLHIAVWKENIEIIDTLLDMHIEPNTADVYGRTPFYCAVFDGKVDIVKRLLPSVNSNKPEKQGFSPLHAALHRGHIEIAKMLLPDTDINARDKYGRTPLQVAFEKGHVEMIKTLADMNADVCSDTKKGKHTRFAMPGSNWSGLPVGHVGTGTPANSLHRRDTDKILQRFRSGGNCPNQIHPTRHFDSSFPIVEAFGDKKSVSCFLDVLGNETNAEKFDRFLKEPVMKMSGHFLGMGLKLTVTISITLPLYFLMNKKHLVMMELINSGILNVTQDELEVPMLIAIHNNDKNFVSCLLDKGAQPTEEAKYIAALDGNLKILKLIMRRNNFTTGKQCTILNGNSALTVASKKGLTDSVKCLLDHGADINHRTSNGLRALDKAVIYNHVNVCKVLIEAGAALNMRSGKFKRTPLHVAADKNQHDIVKLLLHHGASAAVKDHRGHYAIHLAAIGGFTDVVKTFLEHDINLSKQRIISYGKASYIRGMTVLHIAVWKENIEMIDVLLDMHIEPNTADVYGRTPFYCAVFDGKVDIVKRLLPSVNSNKPEKQGFSPLHAALHRGHIEIAKMLLPDTDINARDKYGRTPLQVAFEKGHVEMIKTLADMNADVSSDTKKGKHIRLEMPGSSWSGLPVWHGGT